MKKRMLMLIITSLLIATFGCNKGPSEEEIEKAMSIIIGNFDKSMKQKQPEVLEKYANAIELRFKNDEETIVHDMSFQVNEDKTVRGSGNCVYTSFLDPETGSVIDGQLTYELEGEGKNKFSGNMTCDVTFEGLKVKTLKLSMNFDSAGNISDATLNVNDKDVSLDKRDGIMEKFKSFSPRL